jgi:hypothetical protein
MWVVGVGLLLNLLVSVAFFGGLMTYQQYHPLAAFMGVSFKVCAALFFTAFLCEWGFALGGFVALVGKRYKLGTVLITIGSLLYIPFIVGLLAIGGAIRLLLRAKRVPASSYAA